MIELLLLCLMIYPVSGILSLSGRPGSQVSGIICAVGSIIAAVTGIIPVLYVLSSGIPLDIQSKWGLPLGSFHLHLDRLSAWFAIPVLIISALAAIYGTGYMSHYSKRAGVMGNWFFYQMLSGGMLLVLLAGDVLLFLIAWEIMSMAAWFLVMFEHDHHSVRRAGLIYLAATHLGTAFLFAMFILSGAGSGTFDFPGLALSGVSINLIFILALLGFGAKAGFFGLHVWLPEAHPAAPSHVSGLMSGVMIKTGIYGLLRVLMEIGPWPAWWGWTLIGIGAASGIGGVLYAMLQHDLKRLLAYHSVENIGIICLGIGMGILGVTEQAPVVAILGFSGALLHVLNHSIFKTALFMGAGSVIQACGTHEIDALGGLQKRMPVTASTFLIAAAAISGLPPLNGFVSEFLIYMASFGSLLSVDNGNMGLTSGALIVIASLAFIGGLASMCFTKVFGVIFLGEPRSRHCLEAREASAGMKAPMLILAGACIALGLGGPLFLRILAPVAAEIHTDMRASLSTDGLQTTIKALWLISAVALGGMVSVAILYLLRRRCQRNRSITIMPTWGCGYTKPDPRMQYTGSSYAQPLLSAFRSLLRTRRSGRIPEGCLPAKVEFGTETEDPFMNRIYAPLFTKVTAVFEKLRFIQYGRNQGYILYILLALLGIIIWSFR